MYPSDLNDVRWAKLQPLLLEPRGARHAAGRPVLMRLADDRGIGKASPGPACCRAN